MLCSSSVSSSWSRIRMRWLVTRLSLCYLWTYLIFRSGRCLATPYKNAFRHTYREEHLVSSGEEIRNASYATNVIRYFPAQALNSAFKDYFKFLFNFKRTTLTGSGIITSGDASGALSLLFVSSRDCICTCLTNNAKSTKGEGACELNGPVDVYRETLASDLHVFIPSVIVSSSFIVVSPLVSTIHSASVSRKGRKQTAKAVVRALCCCWRDVHQSQGHEHVPLSLDITLTFLNVAFMHCFQITTCL
ncbi:hypothetical protein BDQ12DRAFT_674327 [Crucibulum laeve]|uniref:ADP/ATP translocase n=1 Tax=Crucibulum laeve TaxID=68775 RepID=A0A5C3MF61_9AGAR|nr:hypothetical protein BDQ12DRAFT_674327 [Crucibulum laeve]